MRRGPDLNHDFETLFVDLSYIVIYSNFHMFSAINMLFIVKFVLFNKKLLGHSRISIFLKHPV